MEPLPPIAETCEALRNNPRALIDALRAESNAGRLVEDDLPEWVRPILHTHAFRGLLDAPSHAHLPG